MLPQPLPDLRGGRAVGAWSASASAVSMSQATSTEEVTGGTWAGGAMPALGRAGRIGALVRDISKAPVHG
ncbi:hypothetical protein ACU4GG_34515 [Streptomyces nojiriensis]